MAELQCFWCDIPSSSQHPPHENAYLFLWGGKWPPDLISRSRLLTLVLPVLEIDGNHELDTFHSLSRYFLRIVCFKAKNDQVCEMQLILSHTLNNFLPAT